MRCFVAVDCPLEIRDRLCMAQDGILPLLGMKAVGRESLHITLKFLGEVGKERIPSLVEALSSVDFPRFNVTVKGLGAFPHPAKPRVVWAGIGDGSESIISLKEKVDIALAPLGFPKETNFHPHLTLARVKGTVDGKGLGKAIEEGTDTVYGSYAPEEFALMESRLSQKGPEYSKIAGFRLKGPA